ncbi:MAG TPA: VTT domain-containing protein [Sphingomicrobium sp.]|nr:VTT domain-containing protein [Sphingomicrobium sp.]
MLALAENELLLAAIVLAVTTAVIALWLPGLLLPIAASSGAVMNVWIAAGVVSLGALAGSMIIFATTRRFAKGHVPERIAAFLQRFEARFHASGAWVVFGLRLAGTPHFLVSAASALSPMPARSFALATAAGMAPAILLATIVGSAI